VQYPIFVAGRIYVKTIATAEITTETIAPANTVNEIAANTYCQPGRADKGAIGGKPGAGTIG
jgi:hypothetical protein